MAPTKPPSTIAHSPASPATHSISNASSTAPAAHAESATGSITFHSRRSTRSVDTLRKRNSGGKAKPTTNVMLTATPCAHGAQPGAGNCWRSKSTSNTCNPY